MNSRREVLRLDDLQGLWHRSLIVRPDGTRDTTTWVAWLQGPSYYIDLRQLADRPSFRDARGLRHLTAPHLAWLATQEGFAGRLVRHAAHFEWRRAIDFQPTAQPDCGSLWIDGDMMVEEGRDVPYVEHWHRECATKAPCGALRLRDRQNGCEGFIVRAGHRFMYARGNAAAPPPGTDLAACVQGASSLQAAQDLLDCEVSFGRVGSDGWTIERSSLPYREGARLNHEMARDRSGRYRCTDLTPDGAPTTRKWDITDSEGDIAALVD